ncbi:MAG: response regulator transcription factor [Dehalococcoidia bacterium]
MEGNAPTAGRAVKPSGGRAETILVVDDDPIIVELVSRILDLEGFPVESCGSGGRALQLFEQVQPDLVILDIRIPEMDGISVCRAVRTHSHVPIIMLTAIDDEADAARALESGADDYVRKPFGASELAARVKAALRRADSFIDHTAMRLAAGPISIDEVEHLIKLDGNEVALSPIEFKLVAYMARHQNRVLTHDQILTSVWGARYAGSHHVLRVTMSRLRQKLGLDRREDASVQTLGGIGYRFSIRTEAGAVSF